MYIYIYIHTYLYIYICICLYKYLYCARDEIDLCCNNAILVQETTDVDRHISPRVPCAAKCQVQTWSLRTRADRPDIYPRASHVQNLTIIDSEESRPLAIDIELGAVRVLHRGRHV